MMLDYELLRVIWWLFLGVLLIGLAIMDGFDLGVAALLPAVARTDVERRVTINTIGPVWDGNQVWLILGCGAIFATWPAIYATAFSGFYIALFLVLAAQIIRPVGFEFRNKITDPRWRSFWDWELTIGGTGLFGIIATAGVSMFPFLLPSSLDPMSSLTVWDASSSQRTLFIMLICTPIFLPIVLAYTSFVFRTLRGRVTAEQIERNPTAHY